MPTDQSKPPADRADLVAIGERLRTKRTERGLTLSEIEAAIKVQVRYLEALEDARINALPGPVYATGFVRSYAAHLGLDGLAVAAEFRAALERPAARGPGRRPQAEGRPMVPSASPEDRPPRTQMPAAPVVRRRAPRAPRRASGRSPATSREQRSPVWRLWLALLLILALAAAVYVVYSAIKAAEPPPDDNGLDPQPQPPPPEQPDPEPPPDEPVFGPERISTATGPEGELLITVDWDHLRVELVCGARVWIRVLADGRLAMEGTELAGAVVVLEATDRLEIRLGRAVHTVIRILDVEVGPAGETDDPRTVVIRLVQ